MAGNRINQDEESQYDGNTIQPFSSTPVQEMKIEEEKEHNVKTLRERIGFEDLISFNVWRASLAELLGTAVLVFMLDTIVISTFETGIKSPNLIMAILVSFLVAIILRAIMPISGGHLNPTVSFSAALVGLVSFSRAAIYITAQCAGAVLGALALKRVVSSTIVQTFSLAGCTLTIIAPGPDGPITTGLQMGQALWLEIICTFIFLFASIRTAFDSRQVKLMGSVVVCLIIGIVVGLLVFVSTTITTKKGYAGVGMNPARCLGPAIVRGGHLWAEHWIFWAGPGIASVAFYLYVKIIPK